MTPFLKRSIYYPVCNHRVIILCMMLFVGVAAFAQDQIVKLSKENTVGSIIRAIEQQTNLSVDYSTNDLDPSANVRVSSKTIRLSTLLNEMLENRNLSYRIYNKHIIISPLVQKRDASTTSPHPTELVHELTGQVVDGRGESVIGAAVRVVGAQGGTITNVNGKFSIQVTPKSILEISYIGYATQHVHVGQMSTINVVMSEDQHLLDEVVVVGYGTQRKIDLTGSVSSIGSKELMKAPLQNVSNLLTGKFSGLTSIQTTGKPGVDGTALYVRGINSFGGGGPIVIIDGVPGTMDYMNPNDIESISILKDAAASIYGVQGANGVILITTKSGNRNTSEINYTGSYTFTHNTAMPEFLDAKDYMYWNNKARQMDGLTPLWTADIQNKVCSNDPNSIYGETDWLKKIFHTGSTQQHNISASGTTRRIRYYTSLGYMDQQGTLRNTAFTRFNVRTNLDIQVAKNLRFISNISGFKSQRDWPGTSIDNQSEFNPIKQATETIPIIKSEYQGLPTAYQRGSYYVNGYAALYNSGYKKEKRWTFDSNYKLEYDFSGLTDVLKGLKLSVFGAYNYGHTTDANFDNYYQLYYLTSNLEEGVGGASGYTEGGSFTKASSWSENWLLRPQLEYVRDFGQHHVGLLFLYEKQLSKSSTMSGFKRKFHSTEPVDISLGTEFPELPVAGEHSRSGQASWVGRLNYSFANKYLFEFTFREDGSYVFAPENRWGFFPSVSAGWVVSQEKFFQKLLPVVDYFKIRASYGSSGKDNVSPFLYNSNFGVANNSMVLGSSAIAQFYTTNPYVYRNLTWSTTHSFNLGFDVDLWNQKLGIELDLFYQLTSNILESRSGNYPPSLGGYYPSYQNSGKVDNRGFELTITHHNRLGKDFSYMVKGMFSFARNKVLREALTDNYPNYRAILGHSLNAQYGFKALGLFQTQEQIDNYPAAPSGMIRLGDIMYADINGDGVINSRYDYVKIGYGTLPEINYSFNVDVNYKDFYLTMLWQGVDHCDYELSGVYDTGVTATTVYTSTFEDNRNSPCYLVEGAWTPENTNAKYPRLSTVPNGNNAWRSTWWTVNGQYLRLKALNIGYNVPVKFLKSTPFSRLSIYLAGSNLLTFSHFKYVDPESPSVSNGYYPQQRTYSIGLNVTF